MYEPKIRYIINGWFLSLFPRIMLLWSEPIFVFALATSTTRSSLRRWPPSPQQYEMTSQLQPRREPQMSKWESQSTAPRGVLGSRGHELGEWIRLTSCHITYYNGWVFTTQNPNKYFFISRVKTLGPTTKSGKIRHSVTRDLPLTASEAIIPSPLYPLPSIPHALLSSQQEVISVIAQLKLDPI